ncbi:MAG: glycerol-3-phosphate dehydrogenase/oxidase [Chloroflexi bacterium]|nr:glycerol-3-phosphate dehydrogenase/oxidase [Chloroflexota bacterium]
MQRLSLEERSKALRRMASEGVDVLVIGGGITGVGVALDAAMRGYSVGLVEKSDFSSGTSSKSTKLVHGGIRYLSQFDFALTRESLVERGRLFRNAPFLVRPIGFVLPLYAGAKKPMGVPVRLPFGIGMSFLLRSGLIMYDLLSGKLGIRRHRRISKRQVRELVPCLKTDKLLDAFVYYDGQTDDSRLTVTVARTAALYGAMLANHAELTGLDFAGNKIKAARVLDRTSGEMLTIPARIVVNAGGVFAARIERLAGPSTIRIKPAKGAHLTVPREALRMKNDAVVLPETEDGRLLFLVPWGSRVTIGTTDTEGGDIDYPSAGPDDVAYLLRHVNRYMRCDLKESDIISAWAGYRPLVNSKDNATSSKLSRTHAVIDGPGGLVTIVGGKLTTYRRMAQDVMDHVSRRWGDYVVHTTERLPLTGSKEWREAVETLKRDAPALHFDKDIVRRLSSYGSNCLTILNIVKENPSLGRRVVPDLPYIMAEVVYSCRYEMALTLEDVLAHRLRVNFEDWNHGLDAAPAVAQQMASELGWDADAIARQISCYRAMTEQELSL